MLGKAVTAAFVLSFETGANEISAWSVYSTSDFEQAAMAAIATSEMKIFFILLVVL